MKHVASKENWFIGLFLFVATVIAYQPVWHAGFIWNDDTFLLNNALIRQPNGLYGFWFTTSAPDYFPMTSTTLWLEWRLWGENPLGYHLVNLALHALSAVLWWRILAKLKIPLAWLAAGLFALHPVNVESVAWITERKNTLAMFFYASALLAYLKFDETGRRHWYWLSAAAFLLSLLSKTAAVMLPFVLLGLAWYKHGRIVRKDLWRSVPFFAIALLLGLVTVWFQYNRAIGPEVVRTDNFASRIATAGCAVWFYFYKAMVPLNLSFVYPRWNIDAAKVINYVPAVLVVLALVVGWVDRNRWGKAWLAGFGYFVLMLLPVLGFLNIYFMRYSLVADHWQYFSIIGPMALAVAAIARVLGNKTIVGQIVGGTLLVLCGVLTWQQTQIYKNLETLWRDTVATNPSSAMVQNALGDVLLNQGRLDEAIGCFQKSVKINPNDPLVHNNLAIALVRKGNAMEAVAVLNNALKIPVRTGEPQNNLAWLLATCPIDSVRDGARAVQLAEQADQLSGASNPLFVDTLAAAYAEAGRFAEAIAAGQRALELATRINALDLAEMLQERIHLYNRRAPMRDTTLTQ